MSKTLAYIRASTDKQDLGNQKLEILEYAHRHNIKVDDYIEITISSRKTTKQRRIDELTEMLEVSDTLIVTELSRLGRSTAEVIAIINELINRKIRVIIIKQSLDINPNNGESNRDMTSKIIITLFSLFAEMERDLISWRTKDALAAKKSKGIKLGKPLGTIQKSKFDKDKEKIQELLAYGLSVRKITKLLGYSNHESLNTYVQKRNLRI